jgi:CO/xanthine dehydrogenase FAD-binding subunit
VVFIGSVPELLGIERRGSDLVVGAATTLADLERHPETPPALGEVLRSFASPAIRNRGTIGGNICNGSPAGDTLPYLYAHDASCTIRRGGKERHLLLRDLITGPGALSLDGSELLTAVTIPLGDGCNWFYRKVAPRKSNALSKLAIYAEVTIGSAGTPVVGSAIPGDSTADLRIAIGGAAPTVIRVPQIENEIVRAARDRNGRLTTTIEQYRDHLSPIDDQRSTAAHRMETALALVHHAVATLLPGANDTTTGEEHTRSNS